MKYGAILLIISALFLPATAVVHAQGGTGGATEVNLQNPLGDGDTTIATLLNRIVSVLRDVIAPPIVALMVLIGAFQILFASGNPEKFKAGKRTILYTVIGYAIILIASGITSIIESVLSP